MYTKGAKYGMFKIVLNYNNNNVINIALFKFNQNKIQFRNALNIEK